MLDLKLIKENKFMTQSKVFNPYQVLETVKQMFDMQAIGQKI